MHPLKILSGTILLMLFIFSGCKQSVESENSQTAALADTLIPDTLISYQLPVLDSGYINLFFGRNEYLSSYSAKVKEFYSSRSYNFAWFNTYGLSEQSGKVVNLIKDYMQSGVVDTTILIPGIIDLYDSVSSETIKPPGNDSLILRADVMFTTQFFIFSQAAWTGLNADKIRKLEWFLPVNKSTEVTYLNSILSSPSADIPGTEPVFRQYLLLKDQLKAYSIIQKKGGWPEIAMEKLPLKPYDTSDVIASVKKRLFVTDDFKGDTSSGVFDTALQNVIAAVRLRYGLTNDTIVDSKLIAQLNVSTTDRIRQIMLNLERWKWVPADPGENFIAVNIPEFMLHVFEKGKVVKSMKVIVGKDANKTVIFSGDLKYVVFSPYWVIGGSILAKETLPAVKRNSNYLSNHNMEVVTRSNPPKVLSPSSINWSKYNGSNFPYIIRQKPGPANSLGYVKFLFPNSYSIYLHDTPSRNLFEKEGRTFSHGCIRIAEPSWLANYLLRDDPEWNESSIDKAMHQGKEKYVTLKKPVPVYITYFTSWVDKNGKLNFRDDVYGHDLKLEKELFK